MPFPRSILRTERDPGVTNIRNLSSPHWRRWLGHEHRCLVQLTSFSEPRGKRHGAQCLASTDGGPILLAGIEARGWNSVRTVKDGETTDDLFDFMTSPPNAEVGAIHPKAMPVILNDGAGTGGLAWRDCDRETAAAIARRGPDPDRGAGPMASHGKYSTASIMLCYDLSIR